MPEFELELDRVATGGAALGPGPDGRIVFVTGALPGERVRVVTTAEHRARIEAATIEVLKPAPGRRDEPCRHVGDGCGGCDWQHAEPETQRELRRAIVLDCLHRLGGLESPDVRLGPELDPEGYRTTVRAAVRNGRAGYRSAGSHDVVSVDSCLVAHPLIEEILIDGRFGQADEVTIRVGARTGQRMVIVHPTAEGVELPDDVIVVGDDELTAGREVYYHEEIAGRSLRISARSFFQCRPDGAEVLVELAAAAIGYVSGPLLDAYCGVGLFGAVLAQSPGGGGSGAQGRLSEGLAAAGHGVTGVESNRGSVADAAYNYGRPDSAIRAKMERWRPEPFGAVIADPARIGLGKKVVPKLAATGADVIALISCDPASLARDAVLLARHDYRLDHVTVVDLFGQTSHVETVTRFVRHDR